MAELTPEEVFGRIRARSRASNFDFDGWRELMRRWTGRDIPPRAQPSDGPKSGGDASGNKDSHAGFDAHGRILARPKQQTTPTNAPDRAAGA